MNESPLFHSSAKSPPNRNKLSPPVDVTGPLVELLSRASAPSRTASAPAAEFTLTGLMISGSVTARNSSGDLHPMADSVASAMKTVARRVQPEATVVYVLIRRFIPQKPRLMRKEKYVGGANAWNSDGASPVVPNASGSTPVYLVQMVPMLRTAADATRLRARM